MNSFLSFDHESQGVVSNSHQQLAVVVSCILILECDTGTIRSDVVNIQLLNHAFPIARSMAFNTTLYVLSDFYYNVHVLRLHRDEE